MIQSFCFIFLQDIPVEDRRYGASSDSNVKSLGVLESDTKDQDEEMEEMFMTPPETLSGYGFRLRLQGTGLELFQTEPGWNNFCLHGSLLEPVWNGSKWIQIGPVQKQVQFWIHLDLFQTGSRTVLWKAYLIRF